MDKLVIWLKYFFPLLVFFVIIFVIIFLPTKIIQIRQIECFSQFGSCDEEIFKKLADISGKNLKIAKNEAKKILESDGSVREFSMRWAPLDKLKIAIILKKAEFAIQFGDQIALIDKNGEILGFGENEVLPILAASYAPGIVGDTVSPDIKSGLENLYYLNKFFEIKSAKISDGILEFNLNSGPKIVFPLDHDVKYLIGSLILVNDELNKASSDSTIKMAKVVDFRYKNPIIKI